MLDERTPPIDPIALIGDSRTELKGARAAVERDLSREDPIVGGPITMLAIVEERNGGYEKAVGGKECPVDGFCP